jgi:hypothetical protein
MRKLLAAMAAVALMTVGSIVSAQMPATHTMTGTVVTASDEYLIVDTSSGRMTLRLDSMLDRIRYNDLKAGSRVEFTHKTDDQGVLLVTDVKMDPAYATTTTTTTTTTTDDRYAADQLPQTASPLAIVAVVGAAALALGAALRKRNPKHLHAVPKAPKA